MSQRELRCYSLPTHATSSEDDLRAVRGIPRDHLGERARLMVTPASHAHPREAETA